MLSKIDSSWLNVFETEFQKEYYTELIKVLALEYQQKTIYPPKKQIFNAFRYFPLNQTKVVIIGQDPYHGQDQAHGLSFSVNNGVPIPPSLKNIFKELYSDTTIIPPINGNLETWAKQGVLLLNSTLTVQSKTPNSHQQFGWGNFTDSIISNISSQNKHVVFILWGASAQKKKCLIDDSKHLILESSHPSPFSAHKGFLGSKPFTKINDFLINNCIEPIDWKL
jgi:uracil-DNA glycosylase